ncbi:MAG: RHS repeat-associated core domain-containing protein [Bellilinea sp.]
MTYTYDGDGRLVKSVVNGIVTYYVGAHYEKTVQGSQQNERKYYFVGANRIAMLAPQGCSASLRKNGTLTWLLTDHLGSTSVSVNASGNLVSSLRYTAFGEVRATSGTTSTDYRYTGQRSEAEIGLYYYVARFYDPALGRFVSADTVVSEPGNPIDWDRYSYVRNNPVNNTDPTGHMVAPDTRENGCSGRGPACIIDMYYAESGDSEGLYDSLEAYVRRNPDYDPTQDQELTGTAPFIVVAAKTRVGIENGSFWDYVAFGAMAGFGSWATGYAPYDLRTKPLAQPSQQRRDIWGDPDCAGCGFVASTLAPQDILMPGGSPIGTYRKNPQIRTVANVTELNRIYNALTVDATPINVPSYNGQWYQLPNGGRVGWRDASSSGGPTIDIDIPGIPFTKIHIP